MSITYLPNSYVFVPRGDWGAKHSAGTKKMANNRTKVFIHHSAGRTTNSPCRDMLALESVLHQRGLAPGYSYAVHPTGVVLEGAGHNIGAHTGGHNSEGFGICFMGNMDQDHPTLIALVNAARTINLLRLGGLITADLNNLEIVPHNATKPTACPGINMLNPINGKNMLGWIRWAVEQGV